MTKRILYGLFLFFLLTACKREEKAELKKEGKAGVSQKKQGLAQRLSPGIPKGFLQRDYCVDSSGAFAYTTIQLPNLKRSFLVEVDIKNQRSVLLPFSGSVYKDLEPMLSPDGSKLLFASNRPLYEGDSTGDYNLWFVERREREWGKPAAFDSMINTEADEFYPCMNNAGDLYFTAVYPGRHKDDLYVARFADTAYDKPLILPFSGLSTHEFNAWVSPDDQRLVFSAYGYANEVGGGDLYLTLRDSTGNWLSPQLLHTKINTSGLDYNPFVRKDTLYFTSKRMDDRWKEKEFKYLVEIKMMADTMGIGRQGIYFIALTPSAPVK